MARRETLIARSIVFAVLSGSAPAGDNASSTTATPPPTPSLLARFLRLLRLYWLTFRLVQPDLFRSLRGVWQLDNALYHASFRPGPLPPAANHTSLRPLGDMGYSGSTFFATTDDAFLVKSIPRHFEHGFFKNELILPYAEHMRAHPASLLVRITDFLEPAHHSLGQLLGLAPSHHIVMENLLHRPQPAPLDPFADSRDGEHQKWESWDLKPTSYFFPERDVAGGALASEATKSKLADKFDGKIYLCPRDAATFKRQLEKDTQLLADANAVDYSLFLVRVSHSAPQPPHTLQADSHDYNASLTVPEPPFDPPSPTSWRTGVVSVNRKEIYRASVLDFFWAKHSTQAKAMTGLINSYRVVDEQGPMSITTESREYRNRFLNMCQEIVEVQE